MKAKGSEKRNILDLNGEELEEELQRIITESHRVNKKLFWTPEKIEILKRLYLAGVRRVDIARALGASKNQVRGKIENCGFSEIKKSGK